MHSTTDNADRDAELDGPMSEALVRRMLAEEIVRYLCMKGVPERKQAAHVADLTGLSIMQARRKLSGIPPWSIEECIAISRHHGDSLDGMLSRGMKLPTPAAQACEVQIGRHWYAASAAIGQIIHRPKTGDLVAYQTERCWRVAPLAHAMKDSVGPFHITSSLDVSVSACANVRVAVLDDDASVARTVTDGLRTAGFTAEAFTQVEEINAKLELFDVFIIDFFLDEKRTATSLIESIRRHKQDALVIVLTGHAREGVDEELAHQIKFFKVQMFEKPARIAYFESAIEAWMDQTQRP